MAATGRYFAARRPVDEYAQQPGARTGLEIDQFVAQSDDGFLNQFGELHAASAKIKKWARSPFPEDHPRDPYRAAIDSILGTFI